MELEAQLDLPSVRGAGSAPATATSERTERNVKIQQNYFIQVSFFQLHGACSDICSICIKSEQASKDQGRGTS